MNLKEAIVFAQQKFKDRKITSASLDAEVLLLETINQHQKNKKDKSWLYLNYEKYILSENEEKEFKNCIERRRKNEPVAYIIGNKEFYGIDFFVDKNVLIPRPETEIIVKEALEMIQASKQRLIALDIGTGSGCIPISILSATKTVGLTDKIEKFYANDISRKAIEIAKINAKKNRQYSKIIFLKCDLENALNRIGRCDYKNIIITANLPYISAKSYDKLAPNVRNFEPKIALTTTDRGLYHINRLILKFAQISSKFDSFYILLEADPEQMKRIEKLANDNMQNINIEIIKDIRGKKRIIKIYRNLFQVK